MNQDFTAFSHSRIQSQKANFMGITNICLYSLKASQLAVTCNEVYIPYAMQGKANSWPS